MLKQSTGLAKVVNPCLHTGQRIQSVLSTHGDDVLIGREAVIHLSPNSDLWSGTLKLKIVFNPGAASSTVMVVKS
uniref:Uncharacterized protein n=1 Tax=Solanum lycopersicum TaxID=4081 RepID=A0A3Q7F0V7_SOLLC